jgi:hypothetical protein
MSFKVDAEKSQACNQTDPNIALAEMQLRSREEIIASHHKIN